MTVAPIVSAASIAPTRTLRRQLLLVLAAVFLTGAVGGAAADHTITARRAHAARQSGADPFPKGGKTLLGLGVKDPAAVARRSIPYPFTSLALDKRQVDSIKAIMERQQRTSDSVLGQTLPPLRKLRDETFALIAAVLTPEQLAQARQLMSVKIDPAEYGTPIRSPRSRP